MNTLNFGEFKIASNIITVSAFKEWSIKVYDDETILVACADSSECVMLGNNSATCFSKDGVEAFLAMRNSELSITSSVFGNEYTVTLTNVTDLGLVTVNDKVAAYALA